jgi:hypothetical protein
MQSRAWLLPMAVVFTSGCGTNVLATGETMTSPTLAVDLTAEIRLVTATELEVTYQLRNNTAADVCVFNQLYRTKPSGERVLDERMAYVLVEEPATLHLTRSVIAIPAGLKVEYPEVPYVTLLSAGKVSKGTVRLPVPVPETHPYLEPVSVETSKERLCKQVYFSIGVAPKSPDLGLRPLPKVGEGIFAIDYGPAVQRQSLIKSSATKLEVQVLTLHPRPTWAK